MDAAPYSFSLGKMPEPQRTSVLAAMTELTISRLVLSLEGRISEKDADYLDQLAKNNATPDAVLNYLRNLVPDIDERLRTITEAEIQLLEARVNQVASELKSPKN